MNAYFVKISDIDSVYILVPANEDHEWENAMWSAVSMYLYETDDDAVQMIEGFVESKGRFPEVSRVPELDCEAITLGKLIEMGKAVDRENTPEDLAEQVTAIWLSTEY